MSLVAPSEVFQHVYLLLAACRHHGQDALHEPTPRLTVGTAAGLAVQHGMSQRPLGLIVGRLDSFHSHERPEMRLFGQQLPYMMWLMQRPTTPSADADYPDAWMHIEIASPWRAAGVPRYIAAAEVACDEYFNPVIPEEIARDLRDLDG